MKKKLLTILGAAALVTLVACGGNDAVSSSAKPATSSAVATTAQATTAQATTAQATTAQATAQATTAQATAQPTTSATPKPELVNFFELTYDQMKPGITDTKGKEVAGTGDAADVKLWKLGENGVITFKATVEAATHATLRIKCSNKVSNLSNNLYYSGKYKYSITLNGTALPEIPASEDVKMDTVLPSTNSGVEDSGALCTPTYVDWIEVDLVAGENTFELKYNGGGFSMYFAGFALAK